MSQASCQRARQFSIEKTIDGHIEMYRSVLRTRVAVTVIPLGTRKKFSKSERNPKSHARQRTDTMHDIEILSISFFTVSLLLTATDPPIYFEIILDFFWLSRECSLSAGIQEMPLHSPEE
jgi:hypothetical protein